MALFISCRLMHRLGCRISITQTPQGLRKAGSHQMPIDQQMSTSMTGMMKVISLQNAAFMVLQI